MVLNTFGKAAVWIVSPIMELKEILNLAEKQNIGSYFHSGMVFTVVIDKAGEYLLRSRRQVLG